MKTNDLIKETVYKFVENNEMFTSMDISQDIKANGHFVRNSAVRDWLKENFVDYVHVASTSSATFSLFDPKMPQSLSEYHTTTIRVRGGILPATLYKPQSSDARDYGKRDQVPMTPKDVYKKAPMVKITHPDIIDIMDGKVEVISRKITSVDRIKIPGALIKKLGWGEGTVIDADKAKLIKTDKPIPSGLKVNKDLRLSIPRDVVSVGNPIKVRCDGYSITFEKA